MSFAVQINSTFFRFFKQQILQSNEQGISGYLTSPFYKKQSCDPLNPIGKPLTFNKLALVFAMLLASILVTFIIAFVEILHPPKKKTSTKSSLISARFDEAIEQLQLYIAHNQLHDLYPNVMSLKTASNK